MFAIDTNLLVYAHNVYSEFHKPSAAFLDKVMNEWDVDEQLDICIPSQVLTEFVNVITRHYLETPLSISEAIEIVQTYLNCGKKIIYQRETQIQTFLELLGKINTRRSIFDITLAATLKDNGITGLYTLNVSDFKDFEFLEVINPLQ